jgi:hypothetical protein
VQDRSHKLFFLTATAFMCAASIYGSQAGPTMLLADDQPSLVSAHDNAPVGTHGMVELAMFAKSESTGHDALTDEHSAPQGTATVVPNPASCPANGKALVSPPTVNSAIGSLTPIEKSLSPSQTLSDAAIGTGSRCPPLRQDAGKAENLTSHGIPASIPQVTNTLSGPVIAH